MRVDDEAEQHSGVAGAGDCMECDAGFFLFSDSTGACKARELDQCPLHALFFKTDFARCIELYHEKDTNIHGSFRVTNSPSHKQI
jgi:hypothetical protein